VPGPQDRRRVGHLGLIDRGRSMAQEQVAALMRTPEQFPHQARAIAQGNDTAFANIIIGRSMGARAKDAMTQSDFPLPPRHC
jgi:hypothetical protein